MNLWRRIDRTCLQSPPRLLEDSDECYFAREYLARQSHDASETNNLIKNFKIKPVATKYEWRKKYKLEAVRKFAQELQELLQPPGISICHIPSSKLKGHPDYDPRFEMLFSALRDARPDLSLEYPLEIDASHQACHEGGSRDRLEFYSRLRWRGLKASTSDIVLVDDVITSGAHFKACQQKFEEHGVSRVIGVFWGVAIDPTTELTLDFADLFPPGV